MEEWYLMTSQTRPNITGGYENDAFADYKGDAFAESLETELATTVILYNHDLSVSKEARCIIQGNGADTQLKSLERTVLFPIGTVKAGMYIFFENRYWLITGYPGNNTIYEKATIIVCQYLLRWQNKSGDIIERWTNYTSASKYDVGENGNNTIFLTSNNYTILVPYDDETINLEGKRVFIDTNKSNPRKVFKITRSDDVLYDYGEEHGRLLSLIADKTELNLETDNCELMICDYISPSTSDIPSEPPKPDEDSDFVARIIGKDNIRFGIKQLYTGILENSKGEELTDYNFRWNIVSDKKIHYSESNNTITIEIDNENYIGSSFLLQIIVDEEIVASKEIKIIGIF
ncbi:hypothetical protein H8S37_04620 [Mediterraneibacter sp. NSJ-55]|uniref:Uncharacterized protein n=1 Tax=Mediterraneibacter hominis TaxID=2763054 RepID=A0A923LHG3_9FIRM|nr:hypothetical protein [Mediterraneibacter hominis]MBC5688212.1 hypothetical protein [Mediterraneibacter hominis]